MQDNKTNRDKLYAFLTNKGVTGIGADREEFETIFEDEGKQKKLYDFCVNKGYTGIGKNYDEFAEGFSVQKGAHGVIATILEQASGVPYPAPKVDKSQYTFTGEQLGLEDHAESPENPVESPEGNEYRYTGIGKNYKIEPSMKEQFGKGGLLNQSAEEYMTDVQKNIDSRKVGMDFEKLRQEQGIRAGRQDVVKDGDRYYTPGGSYDNYLAAGHEADMAKEYNGVPMREITEYYSLNEGKRADYAKSVGRTPEEIEKAYESKEKGDINNQMSDLYRRINAGIRGVNQKKSALQSQYEKERGFGGFITDALMSGAAAELPVLQGQLPGSALEGSREWRNLDKQEKMLWASARQFNTAQKIINAAKSGDFFTGMGDALQDLVLGGSAQDMQDLAAINEVSRKFEKGEKLTAKEEMLLESIAMNVAVASQYKDELSAWYNAGNMVGEMIPYMVEMWMNPLSKLGKKFGQKVLDRAKEKYGKDLAKHLVSTKIKTGAAKLGGAALGGYGMSLTTGLPSVITGVQERTLGDAVIDKEMSGDVKYAGRRDAEGLGTAIYKETTQKMLDNASEMLGAGYAKIPFKWLQKVGKGTKVLGWIDNLANSKFGKGVSQFAEKTKWHGPIEEFLEEVHVGLLNPVLGGDQSWGEFFTADNLATIAIGVAVPGAVISTANTIAGAADGAFKVGAQERWKMKNAEAMGYQLWQDNPNEWNDLTRSLMVGQMENIEKTLKEVYNNPNLTPEQKKTALEYGVYSLQWRTVRGVEEAFNEGKKFIDPMLREVYGTAYAERVSPVQANNAYKAMAEAEKNAQRVLGIGDRSVDEWLNGRSAEEVTNNPARQEAIKAYQAAKLNFEGRRDRYIAEKERAYMESDKSIQANDNNGMVYATQLKDKPVYITDGNVALYEDGTIDVNNSSEVLYAKFPDGHVEMASPDKFTEVFTSDRTADLKAAKRAEINDRWKAEFDSAEAQAIELEKREAGTVFDKADSMGVHRIEILNEGEQMSDILIDGKQEQISTEELNSWKQEAGIQSTDAVAEDATDNVAPTGDNVAPVAPVEMPDVPDFFRLNGKNYEVASRNADGSVDVVIDGKRETLPAGTDYSTSMPTDKKGDVQYEQMPVERTHEHFVQKVTDNEARAEMIEKRRKKAEDERKKFDKKPDPGLDPDKWAEVNRKWEEGKKAAQAKVDYWNEVAKREAEITRSETREAVENIKPDVVKETAEEFIAGHLPKITPESFKRETGLSNEEQSKLVGVISNEGVTIEQAAESIMENYDSELKALGFTGDMQDVRNVIIDVLSQGNPRSYAKNSREARETENIEQQRAEAEAWAMGTFNMTLEELYVYEETLLPRLTREFEGFDEKEYYDNLAENYENDTTRESESIGRGGEVLQGEQSVPASGAPAVGVRNEGGAVSNDVQGGGQNGVAQEEAINEPVGNSDQLSSSEIPNNQSVAEGDAPGQSGVYSLSELTDNEGNRFYQKNGSIDLWDLSPLFEQARRQNAPIRLTERNIDHILDEHKKELGDSEESVLKFLDGVFSTAKVLRKARSGGIFVVVENAKTDKAAIIRLYPSKYGDYYNVESAGYYRKNKWKDTENVIAELSEPTQSVTASDVSKPQVPEEGGKELLNAETATTSASEDRNSVSNSQENAQKSGEIAENGGEKKSSIIEEAEAEYRNNPLHGVQFSIDADAYNNEDVTFGESEQSTEGGALVSYQDVIYKRQTIGWVKETQSGRMFAPMVTSFYVPLENATEEDKRSPHYFEGEEDYMRFATLQQMVDYINSKPQQGEIQEPRSVEEDLDNGDKRITNYNSRGEVATVAIERDGNVVSVDSYDEGVLFEHTEYDSNGKASLVTRYDKQGNVISTQRYVNGKRAIPTTPQEFADEAKARAEEKRRIPLRERARELEAQVGVKANIIESLDEVKNREARKRIAAGEAVAGWYSGGQVYLYMPNIKDRREIELTYVHEVVAHHGVKKLLGERFNEFLDGVWNMMSEADKARMLAYVGANEISTLQDMRAAADEYMAELAEKMNLNELEQSTWEKIVDWFKELLENIGFENLTKEDIESMLKASYANLRSTEQRAESKYTQPVAKQTKAEKYRKMREDLEGLGMFGEVALPKGYKWSDGKKYGGGRRTDASSITALVIGDDLYLRDNQKMGGIVPFVNLNNKNHQTAVIRNFRQWPSIGDFMTAVLDVGYQFDRVTEDAINEIFTQNGIGFNRSILRPMFRIADSERRQEKRRINDIIDTAAGFVTVGGKKQATKNRLKKEAERKQLAKEMYSSVLKGDFNDVTLAQIDKFIEDATPANPFGRRISQRLPQRMERTLRAYERTNAVDALFSRISESAVPANERFSEAGRREIEERKKELLKGWAIATDNWHTALKEFTDDTEPIGEGQDSKVYSAKEGPFVIKASKGKPYGKRFRPDIDNIALFNDVFRNSRYEILGYGEIDGDFVRILKQRAVDFSNSTPLTVEERVEYMRSLGFEPINKDNTAFSNGEIVIADLQKSNIVRDVEGDIRVIDADAKLHTKDVGGDYTYPPVEDDLPEDSGIRFRKVGNTENNSIFASTYKTKDGKDINYTSERTEGYGVQDDGIGNSNSESRRSILQRQTDTGVPGANSGLDAEKGEFCVVERVFTENGAFNFTSGEKIESADDVAYIFSALEDAAKEHSFVVYVKDGMPTVVELGMGSFNATMVDVPTASLAYSRINPDHVYFVHNHPSGNLICSDQDVAMLRVFEDMSDVPVTGVIINLKTGKYGTFDTERHSVIGEKRVPEKEERLAVHTLDKQIFAPDYDPMAQPLVRGSQDVAQFLNSQRMGDRPKVSFLILSRANRIIGNIHTPFTNITTDVEAVARYINERVIQFGGENAILYGDFAITSVEGMDFRLLQNAMDRFGKTNLLDVVRVEGNFTRSANDMGLLYEPEAEYKDGQTMFRMGSRVDARMAEVAAHFEGKQLTAEQQAVVDVFGGKADNLTISVKTKEGNERRVVMRQGNEMGAGAKHSLFRHYGMNNGAIAADDILLIPEILANGERVEKKRGKKTVIEYKYTDNNGVEYTVITENNKGREEFANFYTNRKASSAARKTRSEEARDTADDASEDKGSDNSSNTQEEETRFRTVEETSDGNIDDVPTQPLTLMERITNSLLEVSAKNKENLGLRADALKAFGKDINRVLSAMKAQREYDKFTVDTLVKLAKMYFKNAQLLGEVTPYEVARIMGVLNRSVGKRDVSSEATKLMDILLDAHTNALAGILEKAEKVKAKKVNAAGVEVMGRLDKYGQISVDEYRTGKEMTPEKLEEAIFDSDNRLAELEQRVREALGLPEGDVDQAARDYTGDNDVVDVYLDERARLEGLMLARDYKESVQHNLDEIKDLKQELKKAEQDYRLGNIDSDSLKEFRKSASEAILQSKAELIEGYHDLIYKFQEGVKKSSQRANAFVQAQIDRAREIQHNANSDMEGIEADSQGKHPERFNNSVTRTLMSPMPTFQGMLKKFGEKNVEGKGYLYERFMPQATKASDNEFRGKVAARVMIETKLKEIYGGDMNLGKFMKSLREPGITVTYREGNKMKEFELTQGQMLYIYMVNKMSDGQMKLRRMGITDDVVAELMTKLPEDTIRFADWVQDELLKDLRGKYNAVHERVFGAPMAAIENYFPIKIRKEARGEKGDVSEIGQEGKPSTITGSIIKRTKNAIAIDLSADAMQVLMEHIDDMEHWAAFAEFNRDINTLLNYRHFQNQVKNMTSLRYGSGEEMWKNFQKTAKIVSGTYKSSDVDKTVLNIVKGLTRAKINFRGYTAVKQLLSAPAFWTDAGVKELSYCYVNLKGCWKWAKENLPGFAERWEGRKMGNEKLLKSDSDWEIWRNEFVEAATRWGMTPNAAIDALTVAQGARAVYMTKLKQFKKAGYTEKRANEKALQAAAEAYNESQQSSEGMYLSPLQVEGTALAAVFTTFKNSNFGYSRKVAQSVANVRRKMRNGYKEEAIAFMTKQMVRDGLSEDNAKKLAEKVYKKSWYKDIANVAMFGFALPALWTWGGYAIYMILGDDEEEKEKMKEEIALRGALGFLDGIPLGESVISAINAVKQGDAKYFRLPELIAVGDIRNLAQVLNYDAVRGANDVINIVTAMGVGVSPQILTDFLVAISEIKDFSLEEFGMFTARVMSAPQSNLDALMVDDAMENSAYNLADIAERYIQFKTKRNAPITQFFYSDETEQKVIERYAGRFASMLEDNFENVVDDNKAYDLFYDSASPEVKEVLASYRKRFLAGDKADDFQKKSIKRLVLDLLEHKSTEYSVYWNMTNPEDEETAFLIESELNRLEPIKKGEKDADNLSEYKELFKKELNLYKKLDKALREVNKYKRKMQKSPDTREREMTEIREKRAEAIELINNYRNNE